MKPPVSVNQKMEEREIMESYAKTLNLSRLYQLATPMNGGAQDQ